MTLAIETFHAMIEHVPHMRAAGIEIVDMGDATVTIRAQIRPEFIGDPDRGSVHGGIITVMLDTACGFAVSRAQGYLEPIATLDLRIDYLRPSRGEAPLHARAECYKLTRGVAFTRAIAYQDDADDPIAHCAGTFMLGTAGPRIAADKAEGAA